MESQESVLFELRKAVMLQCNDSLFKKGVITKTQFDLAKEKIVCLKPPRVSAVAEAERAVHFISKEVFA